MSKTFKTVSVPALERIAEAHGKYTVRSEFKVVDEPEVVERVLIATVDRSDEALCKRFRRIGGRMADGLTVKQSLFLGDVFKFSWTNMGDSVKLVDFYETGSVEDAVHIALADGAPVFLSQRYFARTDDNVTFALRVSYVRERQVKKVPVMTPDAEWAKWSYLGVEAPAYKRCEGGCREKARRRNARRRKEARGQLKRAAADFNSNHDIESLYADRLPSEMGVRRGSGVWHTNWSE